MKTYFIRHTHILDIADELRQRLWDGRLVAIHFPEGLDEEIGPQDNESLDPADYPANAAQNIRALNELAREGGYVVAEYQGHDEILVGRVSPGAEITLIRGLWRNADGHWGQHGRTAVLKTLPLQDVRVISRASIAELWGDRPPRGALRRWHRAGDRVAHLLGDTGASERPESQWTLTARAWQALVDLAARREIAEYGEFGDEIGQLFPLAVRFPLDRIYWYCNEQRLPPLTVLVINKDTRLPGSGFGNLDLEEFRRLCEEVFDFDWIDIPNPFAFGEISLGGEDPVSRLVRAPEAAEEVYRQVRDRGSRQIIFREALLHAYGSRCAFSGSTVVRGLEAAHIVPWSNAAPRERLDIRNGLLLTAWHHRLFDAGLLWLDEEYRVHVSTALLRRATSFDQAALAELDGKRMRLPHRRQHRPDPALIRKRNGIVPPKGATEVNADAL